MRKLLIVPYFLLPTLWFGTPLAAAPGPKEAPVAGPGGGDPTAGYHKTWEARLPVTGEAIFSPTLRWHSADTYRVQVTGVVDTRRLGAKYDAEFKSISAREFRVRHDHLRFGAPSWVGIYAHHEDHRYVYRMDPKASERPALVRLSLEGIAYDFRISPARLKRESSSTLRVSLWEKGPAPRARGPIRWDFAGLFAGLALVVSLIVWGVRRKRSRPAD